MTLSVRETIMQQVVTLLGGAGKPTGVTISRNRLLPFDAASLPAIVVYQQEETYERVGGRNTVRLYHPQLTIAVECRVIGNDAWETALDPLTNWVQTALLGDARFELRKTEWGAGVKDDTYGLALLHIDLKYLARADDPTATT